MPIQKLAHPSTSFLFELGWALRAEGEKHGKVLMIRDQQFCTWNTTGKEIHIN